MNKTPRKIRSDSALKNLPEERQEAIFQYSRRHSLADTAKWLAEDGITLSGTAISNWRAWHLQKSVYKGRETKILNRLESFKRRNPNVKKKDLDEMGEFLFNGLAIEQEDVKAWSLAQHVQLKRERQRMQKKMVANATRKLRLELAKYKNQRDKAARLVENTTLSFEEKEERMRQILGIA